MKALHNPLIDLRYWLLISLVSVFGTNTGDMAVHLFRQAAEAYGLSLGPFRHIGPLPLLILAFIVNHFLEKRSELRTEAYFWTAIVLIRTGATNIADTLFGDFHLDFYALTGVLGALMLGSALRWQSQRTHPRDVSFVPDTDRFYWLCMLQAGVIGTIVGDELWHDFGLWPATAVLGLLMLALVASGYRSFLKFTAFYWLGVVFARIAGTAAGDWLVKSVERGGAGLGINLATLASGAAFIAVLVLWKSKPAHYQ